MTTTARKVAALVLLALWLAALVLPVATNRQGSFEGYVILILALFGPLIGQLAWIGNPLLLIVLRRVWPSGRLRGIRADIVFGVLLALCFVNALFWTDIPTDAGSDPIVRGIGYYLWMASVAGAAVLMLTSRAWRERAIV